MNLSTTYLGLKLKNPLMPGASPLSDNLDAVRKLEDAGAAAIVLHSLFAEQIERREQMIARHIARWNDNFAEATTLFPEQDDYSMIPSEYLDRIVERHPDRIVGQSRTVHRASRCGCAGAEYLLHGDTPEYFRS